MALLNNTYTGLGGNTFNVNNDGYRLNDDGSINDAYQIKDDGSIYTDGELSSYVGYGGQVTEFDQDNQYTGRGGNTFYTAENGYRLDGAGNYVTGASGNVMNITGSAEGDTAFNSLSGDPIQVGANNTIIDAQLPGANATGYDPSGYQSAGTAPTRGYVAPGAASSTGYSAVNQNITDDQLSVYQLNKMTASDSPYMRQVRYRGRANAHKRGLLDTGISAGYAESAAIAAAQPFALNDSQVHFTGARDFANAQNRSAEFGAGAENIANLQANAQEADSRRFGASEENLASRDEKLAENRANQFNADSINRAGEAYANAQNTADIVNANNALSLSLQDAQLELSKHNTDEQRATAKDQLMYNLFKTAIDDGVLNDPAIWAGYLNTTSGLFPDLGIQLVTDAADSIPQEYIV